MSDTLTQLRQRAYEQRRAVNALRDVVYGRRDWTQLSALIEAQGRLTALEREIETAWSDEDNVMRVTLRTGEFQAIAEEATPTRGYAPDVSRDGSVRGGRGYDPNTTRGLDTTGLEVDVRPQMAYIPTAIYHLFEPDTQPLVECRLRTVSTKKRRVRVSAYLEGYTAQAVATREFAKDDGALPLKLLPTFFPDKIRRVQELTRATLNVLAEDLDNGQVEIHTTMPLWLMARNAAILETRTPGGQMVDFTRYLGAFATPNQAVVRRFLREVAEAHYHKTLSLGDNATSKARAIFNALKEKAGITYVNSALYVNPEDNSAGQRVRLPREVLQEKVANCLDGTLLFASLLEAINVSAALVIVPGHALVGWAVDKEETQWQYLETTRLADGDFNAALEAGNALVKEHAAKGQLRQHSVRDLRSNGITPLE